MIDDINDWLLLFFGSVDDDTRQVREKQIFDTLAPDRLSLPTLTGAWSEQPTASRSLRGGYSNR